MVKLFAQHKVAANLLMAVMLIAGFYSISKINFQFFPTFNVDAILIKVVWAGATAEHIESSITNILERKVKNISNIKEMTSISKNNSSSIIIEFNEGVDMSEALNEVKDEVTKITNLPSDSKIPVVQRLIVYEGVSKVILSANNNGNLAELRYFANKFKRDLLSRGAHRVEISGLPEEEIIIEIKTETEIETGLSISAIAKQIKAMSQDSPAGIFGFDEITRRLRTQSQGRSVEDFKNLLIKIDNKGHFTKLDTIATIKKQDKRGQQRLFYNNNPAVLLAINQLPNNNILDAANIVNQWVADIKPTLPVSLNLKVYNETWQLVKSRLNLLIKNGATGLLFVGLMLFLFLNARVALWIALGIPVSFMATIAALYLLGGSINMISMFALIMALGIIVDDAIVVGEDAMSHYQQGETPLVAVEKGAMRMLAPVVSSSLSTIASFLPLMIVSGIIGKILFDIPLVIICVILASLIESFFVLPGHLNHSMRYMSKDKINVIRKKLDYYFEYFRNGVFRRLVVRSINNKRIVMAISLSALILGIALQVSGRLVFQFFPSPEGNNIKVDISFVSGSPKESVHQFLTHLQTTLKETDTKLGGGLVDVALTEFGYYGDARSGTSQTGDQYANMSIELIASDKRKISLDNFINTWKRQIKKPPGLENIIISSMSGGPPGKDLELRLTGDNLNKLKQASIEIMNFLESSVGVLTVNDDLPYGQEQLIFTLNAEALSLGLNVNQISEQLRSAYDGYLVQTYIENESEIEVRVSGPSDQKNTLASIENKIIILPTGQAVLLSNLVNLKPMRGFDSLRHTDSILSVTVEADLDTAVISAGLMIDKLKTEILPNLLKKYPIEASFQGKNIDQKQTLKDMMVGLLLAILLMYIILTWVFSSYGWSLVVMSVIPFGLVGVIFGHWVLGVDMTILSLFGMFGLSGIVVNDSIVLVSFYKELRAKGMPIKEAAIEASCQRLRAVMLTSLTTIAGLMPILFETSTQAQFLIPMAISISFGLAFATLLVLFYIPSLLVIYEQIRVSKAK